MVPRAVGFTIVWPEGVIFGSIMTYHGAIPTVGQAAVVRSGSPAAHTDLMGASAIKCWQNDTKTLQCINPNRKIFEARKRETAALGTGEKLVLGHPLAATIGDSARCMQNLEKVLFTGPKTSDTVTFICD